MYPLLKSGDIIMYKQIHNMQDGIFWGEMYLISIDQDGDEMVTVKYIQKSDKGEKWIKLVSQNKHHDDRDVSLSKVRALALIKASIRINSMS
jgi:phage repressor protein C with HTH and peptisase S24 domain